MDFPGGPVVKALYFQSRGHGFSLWSGNGDPACSVEQPKKKKRKECLFNFSEICINILVSNDTETRIKTNIPLHTLSCFPLQK